MPVVTVRHGAVLDRRADDAWAALRRPHVDARAQVLACSDHDRSLTTCRLDASGDCVTTSTIRAVTDGDVAVWLRRSRLDAPGHALDALREAEARDAAAELARLRGAATASPQRPAVQTTTTAGAIVVTRFGDPDVLRWEERPVAAPGSGEVRIRHTAIGVNFIDIYARTGALRLLEPGGVPGMEAAGVVEAVGAEVTGLRAGDRVAYACAPVGAYATRRTMPAVLVLPLPDAIDDVTAAAVLLKGLTAEFLIHRVHRVVAGQTVLVMAAAGGTGLLLCRWASALGATVIGTVSTPEKARIAAAHGCAWPLLPTDDMPAAVARITRGRGCDAMYDGVGGPAFATGFDALAVRGHLVSFGQAAGPIPPVDLAAWAAKSAIVSRPNFGHWVGTRAEATAGAARLFAALADGTLRPAAPRTLPLREAATAHRDLEARRTTGATVLLP